MNDTLYLILCGLAIVGALLGFIFVASWVWHLGARM